VPRPRREQRPRRGVGELASLPWSGGSDELDLERTLDAVAGAPFPEERDVVVRERVRQRRSVVLVVDVSGSMKGERVRTAAAAVGALAGELARDRLAVVAFWSDAAVLVRLGEPVSPLAVLDLLLRVPAQGLTNVDFALQTAGAQLAGVPARDARVLLLSDCVHNAGPDPRTTAARLPRLDVLVDVSGEQDVDLGRDLARLGRGRVRLVRDHRDAAAALGALFTD
jgi:Mg-chelatase subunit ChlD